MCQEGLCCSWYCLGEELILCIPSHPSFCRTCSFHPSKDELPKHPSARCG